ncbi:MAG: hypothetical protein ABSD76_16195 [Terriglobales bacterium]|jgi:hypothetical protein
MSISRAFVLFLVALSQPLFFAAQSTHPADSARPASASRIDKATLRKRLISSMPPFLYERWKKYGQWDYKQQGFQYRDSTQFNFGATGNAAKIDKESLMALARAFKPDPDDVNSLDDPELEPNFARNADAFDKLRKMAEQDTHVIRIAPDYTLLDSSSKWPREDVGFSEARWNEYRSFFKSLSLPQGIVRTEDFPGAFFFIFRAEGLCTGGSSAGYVYSTTALAPTTKSPKETLDAEARKNSEKHSAYVFKQLKENWYAFYQVDW